MNIFFDYQAFALQQYGGISRYICELITGINKSVNNKAHLSLFWSNNAHLQEYNLPMNSYPFKTKFSKALHIPNKLYNFWDFKPGKYDIYHSTYFDSFLSKKVGAIPMVTTFYDMIYERLSDQFIELSADKLIIPQKKKIAQSSTHLIAISESTKRDMIELLGIAPEKITVIYLGSSFAIDESDTSKVTSIVDGPYLLYVGNRFGYKNFIPFLRSVAHILVKYKIKLVCAGGGSFTQEEKNLINDLSVNELVQFRPINDIILKKLYKDATAFIFPSLYEGFGIPVLEAFSCRCPCIVSNNSSLPEVAGDGALYIDPTDPDSIVNAVENILLNDSLRYELTHRGTHQLTHFSWQRTVNETLNLYNQLT
ncbi:glycosyltransferase family 4 protein [Spirosoma aureum]|uniref:Glycosyltransferase family 4 protein n=1 Tax=Spirosoma aureum TaxID=2692134 RepID=A0A6G9AIL5_9BACT|nr:glycosyltransferase family 1 protein [Spirosoma aureum]QIP12023.1 glycosyltransferase family 4 protein [Spirosoma aureum]